MRRVYIEALEVRINMVFEGLSLVLIVLVLDVAEFLLKVPALVFEVTCRRLSSYHFQVRVFIHVL